MVTFLCDEKLMDREPKVSEKNWFLTKKPLSPWGQKEFRTFSYTLTAAFQVNNITFALREAHCMNDARKDLLITQESGAH